MFFFFTCFRSVDGRWEPETTISNINNMWQQWCFSLRVGQIRGLAVSLHCEGMTTNEEICQAALRSTLANQEPAANRHALRQKPKPGCRDTEQRRERRIGMRSKKRGKRRRLAGSKKDKGREVWLRRREAGEWNEKIEGWWMGKERRKNSCKRRSSGASIKPFNKRLKTRQNTKMTLTSDSLADVTANVSCKRGFPPVCERRCWTSVAFLSTYTSKELKASAAHRDGCMFMDV